MRITSTEFAAARAKVLLDGVERNHWISADEEARTIERFRTDEQGEFVWNADRTQLLTEVLRGDVAIVIGRLYS